MMRDFDLVYVSYNSEKWIEKCFQSLENCTYDLKRINIYVIDNQSTDNTMELLENVKARLDNRVHCFEVEKASANLGFGKANNLGFARGNSEFVCFLNIDTELYPETLQNLSNEIEHSNESYAMWELRQFPYEHPKLYDAITGETNWCSGAALAVRRETFTRLKGFDNRIFMYAEDVDLSWRMRSFGYKLKYCPKASIIHHSYENAGELKPNQYVNSIINNLLLRYRFGSSKDIIWGHAFFWNIIRRKEEFPGSKGLLLKRYFKHFLQIPHFSAKKFLGTSKNFVPTFLGMDYSPIRDGAFYVNEYPSETPLVSVIVRTCGRPSVLRETLISLRNQTYSSIEVVVVEDGADTSGRMIKSEFSDLNILYFATGDKVGRSRAGNMAMEMAHGKYLNFLDDDDLFYADHVEVLVNCLLKEGNRAAYALAFETPVEIFSKDPYQYQVMNYLGVHKQPYNRIVLCHHNYIPIQSIMFEKSLFTEYGGLDENLDALEDWDLWVRYSLHTDFSFVFKTTSIYRVPYNRKISSERQKVLDEALIEVRNKHKAYEQKVSVYDIAKIYENSKEIN